MLPPCAVSRHARVCTQVLERHFPHVDLGAMANIVACHRHNKKSNADDVATRLQVSSDTVLGVWEIQRLHHANAKFMLRRMAAACLPRGCVLKKPFVRTVLGLHAVPLTEHAWTKQDCLTILLAVQERAPGRAAVYARRRSRVV